MRPLPPEGALVEACAVVQAGSTAAQAKPRRLPRRRKLVDRGRIRAGALRRRWRGWARTRARRPAMPGGTCGKPSGTPSRGARRRSPPSFQVRTMRAARVVVRRRRRPCRRTPAACVRCAASITSLHSQHCKPPERCTAAGAGAPPVHVREARCGSDSHSGMRRARRRRRSASATRSRPRPPAAPGGVQGNRARYVRRQWPCPRSVSARRLATPFARIAPANTRNPARALAPLQILLQACAESGAHLLGYLPLLSS